MKMSLIHHWKYISLICGLLKISGVHSCTSNTVQHKRNGENATLHFQATTISSENPILTVSNMILSPNGSQLLNILYRNGSHIITSECHGCSFTGNTATGDMSVRIDNIQTSAGGTYKHLVDGRDNVMGCVTIYILGFPTKPVITVSKDPSVGESVTLLCRSASTTTPSNHGLGLIYSWRVDNIANPSGSRYSYSTNRNTLTLSNIVKEDANKHFTCSATEDVNGGYTSNSSDSVSLNVIYPPSGPPEIQGYSNGETYTVEEDDQGVLSCSIRGGNPLATLSWSCYNTGSPAVTVGTIVIKNVTWTALRNHERTCTCQSSHVTGDKQNVTVNIQVVYQATVSLFYIEGNNSQEVVTVNEHDEIQLTCVIDSNPASSIKLMFENNVLKDVSHASALSFARTNVACLEGGVYTCQGSNGYGHPSNKSIQLFVRCSPRPLYQQKENITSSMYLPVTLTFQVLAYPEPSPKGYSWQKEFGSSWTRLLSNADLHISSAGLQSNLTILNVSQSDYGQYRVTTTNSIGTYEQFLFLTTVHQEHTTTEAINNIADSSTQSDNTAVIVGATLGLFSFAVVVYATVVTILWKRKTAIKGTKPLDTSTSRPTYVNLGYKSNITAEQEQGCSNVGDFEDSKESGENSDKQYTSLSPYTNDNYSAYDVIQIQGNV